MRSVEKPSLRLASCVSVDVGGGEPLYIFDCGTGIKQLSDHLGKANIPRLSARIFITHTHWDREWYMAYEQHHMRLIQLMDDLLDLFKKDPEFHSFHLDGQTIILDDYLQVKPEREPEVRQAIKDGKLRIGPFYILQDDFLISSESNVRNMLIGKEDCDRWGASVPLGYFPDTFGNIGQTPQLMKGAGLEAAAFGRGIRPTGFNNQVDSSEKYSSQFSEMAWKGPDDSQILGLLFANWYSNGNI